VYAEELHARRDARELGDDDRQVREHEERHDRQGHPDAELLPDKVPEPLSGHDPHPRGHLLDHRQSEDDEDERPQEAIALPRADDGVRGDAARIVPRVPGDKARADHGQDREGAVVLPGSLDSFEHFHGYSLEAQTTGKES
jgi:hypothetical protein